MSNEYVLVLTIKLLLGFISAIVSLMLWSKTRDGAWLTMVLGVIFLYMKILLNVLNSFGFIAYDNIKISGIVLIPLLFETLPFVFFTIGMVIFLLRIRKY